MLFFLDLREFRTTDGEHGTNLAGRGSLVTFMLGAYHYSNLRGVSLGERTKVIIRLGTGTRAESEEIANVGRQMGAPHL